MDKWETLRKSLKRDVDILKGRLATAKFPQRLVLKGKYEQAKLTLTALEGIELLKESQ